MKADRDKQRTRIVGAAIRLAEEHGLDRVGLREVAEEVGLALGTLYKSFRNKDEILGAVVDRQMAAMREALGGPVPAGETAADRVHSFFERFTEVVARHPAFTRGMLGALSTGRGAVVKAILRSDVETSKMVIGAIRGVPAAEVDFERCGDDERETAFLLRQIWFASMIGWSVGLHPLDEVVAHIDIAARRFL